MHLKELFVCFLREGRVVQIILCNPRKDLVQRGRKLAVQSVQFVGSVHHQHGSAARFYRYSKGIQQFEEMGTTTGYISG